MARTGKRIEVRYGAFACRVEGFDDPVAELREVLAVVQRMIAEAPALADRHSGLDDAQFARIAKALTDRRAEDGMPGLVVIRSGDRVAGDIEDADILAEGRGDEDAEAAPGAPPADAPPELPPPDAPPDAPLPDAGPYPSAAVYAAPAAAVAEAAYAAGILSPDADLHEEDGGAQGPLGAEKPDEPATPAALFAAPAAGVAEAALSIALAAVAGAANPDGDAGDGELSPADEAADERAPPVEMREAEVERARRTAHVGPGEGWAPWESAAATGGETPLHALAGDTGRGEPELAAHETDDAWAARDMPEPARNAEEADDADGGADALPAINIFAPPPADATAAFEAEPEAVEWQAGAAVLSDGEDARADEERNDGAGDRPDPEADLETGPEAEPPGAAEDRSAALITRYRGGLHERAQDDPAPDAAATGPVSAAQLAARAGATGVADLLAVSAAWLALAGGRARFTRREVMEVFETLPGRHPRTLEARINGFGNLVRSGTLQLVGEGTFELAPGERARFSALVDQG